MIAAENSDVPEPPVPVPVAVAVTTEPYRERPGKVLIECRVAAGVGGDIHRTDPCLALAETGRIGSRTGVEIDAVSFVGNAVKAALDYGLAVSRSKDGVILELGSGPVSESPESLAVTPNELSPEALRLIPRWALEKIELALKSFPKVVLS